MPATPRKARRFGGDAAHQKAMMGNLVASLIAAHQAEDRGLTTTVAKAKALRPIAEKMVTKAKRGDLASYRSVIGYIRDEDMANALFHTIAPLYEERNGGYLRILKLGPRHGDKAPMARVQWV